MRESHGEGLATHTDQREIIHREPDQHHASMPSIFSAVGIGVSSGDHHCLGLNSPLKKPQYSA